MARRKLRVLLIYRRMIPSIRLCGHCQMEALSARDEVEYRARPEMRLKKGDLVWADIVLLGRLDNWYECKITEALHKAGKHLIYIIDDDLLHIPKEISSAVYYGRSEIQRNIRSMISMSDAILSPSPRLLRTYAADERKAILIEEPAINPVPYKPHHPDRPVKIGFAGSIDRTGDLEHILKDALLRIKQEYGDRVEFEFFGAIPEFAGALGARCIPYCESYDEYRRTLNELEWDIGLAPMPDSPFHACKHYNKFVEYAAAGIVGVFSNVEPYTRLKKMGAPCMICANTPSDWHDAICRWIDDEAEREGSRFACCCLAAEGFSIQTMARALMAQICAMEPRAMSGSAVRCVLPWLKLLGVLDMVRVKARTYGWALPGVVAKKGWRLLGQRLRRRHGE